MKTPPDRLLKTLTKFVDHPTRPWIAGILWVLLISFVAFWWQLGGIGLVDETEPLFAEAARQMTLTGDWITPYFNEATRFDKPPLVYWFMALAYQAIGPTVWAARLPSALSATLLTALTFYTLQKFPPLFLSSPSLSSPTLPPTPSPPHPLTPWLSAFIGSAATALTLQIIVWARTGVADMLLCACIAAALISFFLAYAQPDRPQVQSRWFLAFYTFSGLAVLAKGPIGIVLPGMIIAGFLLYTGNGRSVLREMRLVQGMLVFLVITLPWYILVTIANGDAFINSFFGYHNLQRFSRAVNNHSAPWYFYFWVVPVSFAPWSAHLPLVIGRLRVWRRADWQQQARSAQLGLFALFWFAVIFLFFTITSTKLSHYTLPALPAAAILIALFWSDYLLCPRTDRWTGVSHLVNVLFFVAAAIGMYLSPLWLRDDRDMPDLPGLVQQSTIPFMGGLVWTIAVLVAFGLLFRNQLRWLWLVNLLTLMIFILVTVVPVAQLVDSQRQLPLRQLAATIGQTQQPQEELVMVGLLRPSIVFYAERPLTHTPEPKDLGRRIRRMQRRPTRRERSLLVIGERRKIREIDLPPEQIKPIAEAGVYQVVRVILPAQRKS